MRVSKYLFFSISIILLTFVLGNFVFNKYIFSHFLLRIIEVTCFVYILSKYRFFSINQYVIVFISLYVLLLFSVHPWFEIYSLKFALVELKPLIFSVLALFSASVFYNKFSVSNSSRIELNLQKFLMVLCCLLFLWYLFSILVKGERGAFFYENNFEIIFPLLCYYYLKKPSYKLTFCLLLAVIFSLSRSAMIIFLLAESVKWMVYSKLKLLYKIFSFCAIVLIAILIVLLLNYYERVPSNLEDVDRYVFFEFFLRSFSEFSFSEVLLGKGFGVPLENFVCRPLIFYHEFYDTLGNCYSPIFHSGVLRMIYSGGIIYFVVVIAIFYSAFLKIYQNAYLSIIASLIIMLNSLSVSGYGNTFVVAFIAFIVFSVSYFSRYCNSKIDDK